MQASVPVGFVLFWGGVMGLFIGSFLNVAIHRLPLEDETVSHPRRSRCPKCRTQLGWSENVPLLSWLVQRGRCRHCAWPIPIRYPLVEVLTAVLGLVVLSSMLQEGMPVSLERWALALVRFVVLAGLLVATFVDFDCFEIPDEVSIGGMVVAPICCLLLPELHAESWIANVVSEGPEVGRFGSLLTSLAGLLVGGGILWLIGWIGTKVYKVEAMGFGDVKLLAAGGGFVGPGGALAALMIAACVASIAGVANMLRFLWITRSRAAQRGRRDPWGRSLAIARIAGRYLPFGPYLALGIGITLLYWNDVLTLLP
ncbi:MAG: leader peptidase (prepilin peptidase)/N-methyltransferase [Chlamydiales bacterium]|jgi:leader peptidase (prepilin peptidase)/N-methyltransferase